MTETFFQCLYNCLKHGILQIKFNNILFNIGTVPVLCNDANNAGLVYEELKNGVAVVSLCFLVHANS